MQSNKIPPPNQSESSTYFPLKSIVMPTDDSLTADSNLEPLFLALDAPHSVFIIVNHDKYYNNEWSLFTFKKSYIKCVVYSGAKFCLVPDIDDVNDPFKINPLLVEMASPKAAADLLDMMKMGQCDCVGVETVTLEEMWVHAREDYEGVDKREEMISEESIASRLKALER